jgi:hypothetical protein
MLIWILILIIIILTVVNGRAESKLLQKIATRPLGEISKNLKYPLYCFGAAPTFKTYLPEYTEHISVANIHEKYENIICNPYRAQCVNLFRFAQKYTPSQIVCIFYHPKIVEWFSRESGVPVVNLEPESVNQSHFTKYRGCDLIAGDIYCHKNWTPENEYCAARFNADFVNYLYHGFAPQRALLGYRTYDINREMEIAAGALHIGAYTNTTQFYVECSKFANMVKINMSHIYSRLHIYNMCARNLNHAGNGDYLTYDMYAEIAFVPKTIKNIVGPMMPISHKIVYETLPQYYIYEPWVRYIENSSRPQIHKYELQIKRRGNIVEYHAAEMHAKKKEYISLLRDLETPVSIWLQRYDEFVVNLLHEAFPHTLIKITDYCPPKPWIINYEPIEDYVKLFVQSGDLIFQPTHFNELK